MATVNPWKRFIELLPGGSRAVGTVLHISTVNGTSTVQLRNGSSIIALGTDVEAGEKCFIRDGEIIGKAPNLPQYDIEV